ncbi:MAG: phosphatase PAP2 family protein [bacterium]|nr:phosphatase PAP2 family protein [bacterium]
MTRLHLWRWVDRHDRGFVATVFFVALGVFVLLRLGEYVSTQETHSLDREILLALRNADDLSDPRGPGWIEEIGRDLTALGGTVVLTLFSLAALCYALMRREKVTAAMLFLAVGGGMIVSLVLKQVYDRPRPDLVPHHSIVYTNSFPSGHSMMAAVTYLSLAAILVRVQPNVSLKAFITMIAVLLTVLVGVSRVYLGVHWPSDVVAGWAAGTAWAALAWYVARIVQKRRGVAVEAQGVPPSA